jgi:ABC-type transport system involved in multi-copper enzyme maturation permease subunit
MSSRAKPSGRLSMLVYWELEKTLTFPMLALIIAVPLYQFVPASVGSSSSGMVLSLATVLDGFASGWALQLSHEPITSFTFSVFIFAALTSTSLSRDISSGYMRVILSYPIRRAKLLLSKALVLLFVPFLVFMSAFAFVGALVFPSLFFRISVSDIAYIAAMFLLQMFFMFAVSFSASLCIKQPVMSFLASVVILISTEQISSYLSAPFKYLLPTEGTRVLMDYRFLRSIFELRYGPTDILMPIIGMLVIPTIIMIINFGYFTKRFQA